MAQLSCLCVFLACLLIACTTFCLISFRGDTHTADLHMGASTEENLTCVHKPPHSERVIMVTGAAGFIGFHLAQKLREQWPGATVVGLDNFSNYYDVQLKKDRATILVKSGVHMYQADVCDGPFLRYLFDWYNFTDVAHLAAQAGVRHSLEAPLAYIHSNIHCFLTLLDAIRERGHTTLTYASSSSVYGKDAPVPFATHSPPCAPSSMYAVTKTSNENFADAYCTQYGLRAVGLRFFTVYGPWGRPDMAVYKFADKIVTGRPVPLFEDAKSSSDPIKRDFTYISDVVGGIVAAMDHCPRRCGELYNLGNSEPISMETIMTYLETDLERKAIIDRQPLPPSDLHVTFADISDSQKVLNYQPNTTAREGIRQFVSWFKKYWSERREWEEGGSGERRNQLLQVALDLGREEWREAHSRHTDQLNQAYRDRIASLRHLYTEFAKENGILLPNLEKKKFIFHPGLDSVDSTVIKAPGYQGNVEVMEDRCRRTEQCLAFTTRGEFKNQLKPMSSWTNTLGGQQEGLYVADIDVCEADLHDCGRHSECHSTGPALHTCVCLDGYIKLGKICVERYVEGVENEVVKEWKLSDRIDGTDWNQLVDGRPFVFFPGLDSPGGDYLFVEGGGGDVEGLMGVCRRTYRCLAFNTNGILKHHLWAPRRWIRWTDQLEHGLYVLDIDYCSLDSELCPFHSSCLRHSPGNYSCVCEVGWEMGKDYQCHRKDLKDPSLVHVILSVDRAHLEGLVAVMHSLLQHASRPRSVVFHVVLAGVTKEEAGLYLQCYGLVEAEQLDVVELDVSWLEGQIHVYSRPEEVGNLASTANFARFYFPHLFPRLSRAVYLDADTLVVGDVGEFWQKLQETDQLLLAVLRHSPLYADMFPPRVKELFQQRYGYSFADSDPTFNAGVYGVNLDLWRGRNVHAEVTFWMEKQACEPLWRFGTQPIMLLVAYRQWEWLDQQWNVNGLGWNEKLTDRDLEGAKILHWSGRRKPWLSDGLFKELWQSHFPAACSGRGRCENGGEYVWWCQCDGSYEGTRCQNKAVS